MPCCLVDLARVLALGASLVVLLSPLPSIVATHRAKCTGAASIVPLVSMFSNAHILLIFGFLNRQRTFRFVALLGVGDVATLVYVGVFYWHSHEKRKAHRVFLLYGAPLVLVTVYGLLGGFAVAGRTREEVRQVIGYLSIASSVVLFSSPLEKLGDVLRHRSAVFFNVHMICAGSLASLSWVVYSSLTTHWVAVVANAISLMSGGVQLALYWVFHPATHPLPFAAAAEKTPTRPSLAKPRRPTYGSLE